jgi:hypothetical protein
MTVFWKFLKVELAWAAAIFLLILPVTILSSDPLTSAEYLGMLGRALELALYPAGISVAGDVFARPHSWGAPLAAFGASAVVAVLLFVLSAVVVPFLTNDSATLPQLVDDMNRAGNSWETRNAAAWSFYVTLFAPLSAVLMAAIGVQVGVWATYALPPVLRRPLYWTVALGLIVTRYAVADSTYEVVVLHTAAFVDFAAFYALLIPAGICAGLALPTLALLRGAEIRGRAT